MRFHSRGAHPPRLDSPPLSDGAWELIRSCWVREASKRPGIDVVVSTLAPAYAYGSFRHCNTWPACSSPHSAEPMTPLQSVPINSPLLFRHTDYYDLTSFDMPQFENANSMLSGRLHTRQVLPSIDFDSNFDLNFDFTPLLSEDPASSS